MLIYYMVSLKIINFGTSMTFGVQRVDIYPESKNLSDETCTSRAFLKIVSNSLEFGEKVWVFSKEGTFFGSNRYFEFLVPSINENTTRTSHTFVVNNTSDVCEQIREILKGSGFVLRRNEFPLREAFTLTATRTVH